MKSKVSERGISLTAIQSLRSRNRAGYNPVELNKFAISNKCNARPIVGSRIQCNTGMAIRVDERRTVIRSTIVERA
jgi:hypothetical protein